MTTLGMVVVALVAWPVAACALAAGLRYLARHAADTWKGGVR